MKFECKECAEEKDEKEFYADAGNINGRKGKCIVCYKARVAKRYLHLYHSDPEFRRVELARAAEKYRNAR